MVEDGGGRIHEELSASLRYLAEGHQPALPAPLVFGGSAQGAPTAHPGIVGGDRRQAIQFLKKFTRTTFVQNLVEHIVCYIRANFLLSCPHSPFSIYRAFLIKLEDEDF